MKTKEQEFDEILEQRKVQDVIPKASNIYKALADFQQEVPVIHKNTQGHNYSYSDLPTIFEVINPLLKKHGLGFTQLLNGSQIKTVLFHTETGETITSETEIPFQELRGMNIYQSAGSAITYFRRYTLSSMLGIVTDKDTDAQGQPKKQSKPTLSDDRFAKSLKAIQEGNYDSESLKANFELTPEQLKQLNVKGKGKDNETGIPL